MKILSSFVTLVSFQPHMTFFLPWQIYRSVSYACQGCINLIKNTVKTIILWNIFTILSNCFLFYVFKYNIFLWGKSWIFSIITPVFNVTWSFSNHPNMLNFLKNFTLSSILKTVVLLLSSQKKKHAASLLALWHSCHWWCCHIALTSNLPCCV